MELFKAIGASLGSGCQNNVRGTHGRWPRVAGGWMKGWCTEVVSRRRLGVAWSDQASSSPLSQLPFTGGSSGDLWCVIELGAGFR